MTDRGPPLGKSRTITKDGVKMEEYWLDEAAISALLLSGVDQQLYLGGESGANNRRQIEVDFINRKAWVREWTI